MITKVLRSVLLTTAPLLALTPAHALPQGQVSEDIRQVITDFMTVNYGTDYDKLRGCWIYQGEREQYCMSPIRFDRKAVKDEDILFVLISGDTTDEGAGLTPGLSGLFTAYKLGDSWVISASEPYIYNGGAGRSQMVNFEFRKVGDNKYGWYGEHCSSGAGGHTTCIWELYVPMSDGRIKQIADIQYTAYYEILTHGIYYKTNNYVSFDRSTPQVGRYYPIHTTLSTESGFLDDDLNSKDVQISEEKSVYHYNTLSQKFELVK